MEEPKLVYTPKEVSQLLRIHLMTVYKMLKRGDLPHFRVGKKILIPRHAIEALLGKGKDGS